MNRDIEVLKNMARLLLEGYPIKDILEICRYTTNHKAITSIEEGLTHGESLVDCILHAPFSNAFKEFFYFFSLQKDIGNAIMDTITVYEEQKTIVNKIKKDLSYPLFLLLFVLCFSIFVTYFLMPEIEMLFHDFSIAPPFFFYIVFMSLKYLPIVFISIATCTTVLIIFCMYAIKNKKYKYLDFIILKIPFCGKVIKKYYSMKFAIYYHELLIAGYDSTEILKILVEQTLDIDIKMIIYEIQVEVEKGESLLVAIENFDYLEDMLAQYFALLLRNSKQKNACKDYLTMNRQIIHQKIQKSIKIIIPTVYSFVIAFVVLVYICIILPMMDVINMM